MDAAPRKRPPQWPTNASGRIWGAANWRFLTKRTLPLVRSVVADVGIRVTGLSSRGRRNAIDLRVRRLTVEVAADMAAEGLTIAHLSDFHFGQSAELVEATIAAAHETDCDIACLTGDYPIHFTTDRERVGTDIARVVQALNPRYGCFATLGNYDHEAYLSILAEHGVTPLLNASACVEVGSCRITVIGTDDPFLQDHTPMVELLKRPSETAADLKIVLAHTPELAAVAAKSGAHLYLCGHTHGGQICLPGGRPVLTNLRDRRDLARGLWREESMAGYTTNGVGVSNLPYRFNCPPEIALLRLVPERRRAAA